MGQKTDRSRRRSGSDSTKARKRRWRYYHWYNEPDTIYLPIDLSFIRNIVEQEMALCGSIRMNKFLRERNLQAVYYRIKRNKCNVKVGDLKRFCKTFTISPDYLSKAVVILKSSTYPVDMKSKGFLKMKTHTLNEGRIMFGKKSVSTLSYSNQDPVLLRYFAGAVRESGGDIRVPYLGTNALVLRANPLLARALVASGLPFGRKTRSNPSFDALMDESPDAYRYHIQATLTEEGWPSLSIQDRRIQFYIAWGRSVDITKEISKEYIEEIRRIAEERKKRKIPIGMIKDPYLLDIISQNPPRLFNQEVTILFLSHKEIEWPEGYPTRVHFSKKGRITAFWEIHFYRPDQIDLIHDEYGMLQGTWKEKRFETLYEAYKKYRGRRLTDEEIQEIKKIKEENPPKVSAEWISEKVQELFPGVEWGGDLERIRRMLGRKKSK